MNPTENKPSPGAFLKHDIKWLEIVSINVFKVGIVHDVQGIMANTEKTLSRSSAAFLMGLVEKNIYLILTLMLLLI